jgi:hypothetical protein
MRQRFAVSGKQTSDHRRIVQLLGECGSQLVQVLGAGSAADALPRARELDRQGQCRHARAFIVVFLLFHV